MSRCHTLTPALAPDLPPPIGLDDTILEAATRSELDPIDATPLLANVNQLLCATDRQLGAIEADHLVHILSESATIWHLAGNPITINPTSRQLTASGDSDPWTLQIGTFAHLAALPDPTPAERDLTTATIPCCALVYPHHNRSSRPSPNPLTHAYVPITPAQAVSRVSYASIHTALTTQLTLAAQTLSETIQTLHARRAHFTDRIYQPALLPDDPTPELDTYPAPTTTAWQYALLRLIHMPRAVQTAMIATLILLAALTLLH